MFKFTVEEIKESFEDFLDKITDPRIERNKLHSMAEILFLVLCAVICNCEGWGDIESFGMVKLDFLRRFYPYAHGVPSDDTLRRFFRGLKPGEFQEAFAAWVGSLGLGENKHIAIDGKVSRRSRDGAAQALHMVSAFASDCRMVLAQEKVSGKSNEITAIPALLTLLDLEGATVTVDAMGCQKDIARRIIDQKGDYVLSLKGNQGTLHEDTKLLFQDARLLEESGADTEETIDGSEHGRLETRTCRVVDIPEELKEIHDWEGLRTLIEVTSVREIKGVRSEEKRYYISSLRKDAKVILRAVRSHWAVENSLHWVLDVSFREDDSRIRKGNAPHNMAIVRHTALNLLRKAKGKRDSIKRMRKAAGWNDDLLLKILQHI